MDKGNLVNDFNRLGVVDEGAWSLDVQSNEDYTLCPSYPSVFARPAEASEDLVRAVAKYRSQGRLPCLVWRDPAEVGGVLCGPRSHEQVCSRAHRLPISRGSP